MTEDEIERVVERMIDAADKRLLNGLITQDEYDREIFKIDEWATREYKKGQ